MSLLLVIILVACSINSLDEEKTTVTLASTVEVNPAVISVEKGPEWSFRFTPGPFVIWVYPQMAFWLEDGDGRFLRTLYITGGGKGHFKNNAGKNEGEDDYFKEMLPVWSTAVIKAGENLPTKELPYTDGLTSATPQSDYDLELDLGALPDSCRILAEINRSADHNEFYTEELTDWIGQPSLVYAADLQRLPDQPIVLQPVGRGGLPSEGLGFHEDLERINTAFAMVKEIRLVFDQVQP